MVAVWFRRLVLAAFIVLAFVPESAFAATMDYLGTWISSTTYTTGKVVKHNGGIFYSLKSSSSAPNRNKTPSENPTWWEPVGTVGNALRSGLQAPSPSIGNPGDYYIDTANNRLFGPKAAVTGWPASAVSLIGPAGPAGAQGAAGEQGPAGAQGEQGPAGPQGAQGPAGAQGATGASGSEGPQGVQGPQGIKGAQGPKGETGEKGEIGLPPPGFTVKDADGNTLGTIDGANSYSFSRSGRWYLGPPTTVNGFYTSYDPASSLVFETNDCSETAYIIVENLLKPHSVFVPSDLVDYRSKGWATEGILYYPVTPYKEIIVRSMRNGEWYCLGDNESFYLKGQSRLVGETSSENYSVNFPLSIE